MPYYPIDHEQGKTRYSSRREAEKAAEYQMLLNPSLELYVYQSEQGGWYLTRQKPHHLLS